MLPAVPHRKSALLLLLAVATGAPAAAPSPALPANLSLAPCRLEHPLGLVSLDAECGTLVVPENHDDPGSAALPLFVARLPALSRRSRSEPLYVIAGGPGLGASTFYTGVAPAFARVRRERDIVLVDQRGTGRSGALLCPDEQLLWETSDAEATRLTRECLTFLQRDRDPSQYTTSAAVRDLEAVRQALGHSRIALYGSSYGTRVAQHYARRYPATTLALVLDGVVPPTRVLGPSTPLDAEQALRQIFARCRADNGCTTRFGDPEADYLALRERLTRSPVTLTMPDPRSGEPRELQFNNAMLAGALRLASYSTEQAALLPLTLHMANRQGQYAPLASQYLLTVAGYGDVLALGMHNTVVCTEDVPFFDTQTLDRAQVGSTFLGTSQLDALQSLCTQWPQGPLDADLHAPLHSDVPALLISGGMDPVTPVSFGEEAARGFAHVQHLVLPDQGHGLLLLPCMDRLMAGFINAAAASPGTHVDADCLRNVAVPPFFLNLNGPAP